MAECPFCSTPLSTVDILRGKLTNCPNCGRRLATAAAGKPAAEVAAAPPEEQSAEAAPAPPPEPRALPHARPARLPVRDPVDESQLAQDDDAEVRDEVSTDLDHLPIPATEEMPVVPASSPVRVDLLTLAALCIGAVGLLLGSLPAAATLSKPVSALGLLLGMLACIGAVVRGKINFFLPLGIVVLCLLDLIFMGEWPRAPLGNPYLVPVAVPLDPKLKLERPVLQDEDWVDAEVFAIRDKDIKVQVVGAIVTTVDDNLLEKPAGLRGKQLLIQVRVSFEGTRYQTFQFDSWANQPSVLSKNPAKLVDDQGHALEQVPIPPRKLPPGRKAGPSVLTPGRQVGDLLVYPVPAAGVEYLHLELPAAAFQAKDQPPLPGRFRFKIPRSMIKDS